MAAALNEESVEKKLKTVNNTQDSIQSLSLWIIHHKSHHERICKLWMKVLKKTVHPSHRLTLFYLCNDVVQTCKKKKAYVYNTTFKEHLREAACLVRDITVKKKVERIFNIWQERGVYDAAFVRSLQEALNGKSGKSKTKTHKVKKSAVEDEEVYNGPISPVDSPVPSGPAGKQTSPVLPAQNHAEEDEEESARILAEFKPHEMIEQITAFTRQATDIKFKLSQITHLKLDMSSAEAVKRLKDRAHGNDFSNQFEDSCNKLAELVKRQTQHVEDQRLLLQTLNTSETFYEEQYREAKIVANAYKNFGARINNMKKKLDELKRTFPQPDSPVPSPDVNAPSPGNTPPHLGSASYTYNPSASGANYKSAWYNGTRPGAEGVGQTDQDVYDASPPLEAPSPEGSPPDLNLGGTDSGSLSLESRLASFFDQGRSGSSSSNPPVYTPQLPASLAAAKLSSKQVTTTAAIEEDGNTTPLDDEAPTTPVQDEVSLSSPPPPPKSSQRSPPPKKENPIDFLSRLISQTQKGASAGSSGSTKTGAASFLDSLTMLNTTSAVKKSENQGVAASSAQSSWSAWSANSGSLTSSSMNNGVGSSGSNAGLRQSSSPSMPAYAPTRVGGTGGGNSLPTSPVQFPSTPQPVPPPIPLPVPPPPMALKLNLNMPPPPPPPFLTSPVPPPNFTSPPPPIFQQTSPGQKENWPEVVGLTNVPTLQNNKQDPGPPSASRLADPDAMEIVSDEDDASLGIVDSVGASGLLGGDAKTEFANKLRQKTLAGPNAMGGHDEAGLLKSHVFVPNPERPNLMTLTVPDDLDEEDMVDKDTKVDDEAASSWKKSSSSRKSRSRSRSRSREKERSHRHKKKKKHKRNHSDDEDFRVLDDSRSSSHGVGSVVKKVSSRGSRDSRDSKGEKYEDDKRYDKYDDRKYDRYDDKGYRGEHKSYKSSHKGDGVGGVHRDSKDGVEAYTQAYRDALLQQYSGRFNPFPGAPSSVPPPDPRRYGKY
ncbi:hypothetical protein EGW08_008082 [Elysia chlorotica]|uniref:Regulation of nuclear pre-mRNA domain-containing protein 2 n=1 Tax=Elysia chlorotica TaxID=188477 RepID=A0A433TRG8_ELYCH|nr:hypothetical protein EGW08_008082 [Elysia chlorotica]